MRSRRTIIEPRSIFGTALIRSGFTHTAYNDFEVVAANLLDKDQRRVSDRIVAYNLYTDPPLGRVGMTEAEVRKSSKRALIGTMAMENVSRDLEKSETKSCDRPPSETS
jgi:pyruvate/2-oxoglutarate dehydrogenase complex dihydrolipoamide dehydrogenase (E3) component